jgi:enoyl-CoA hydratase/carnithine racemase
VFFRRTFDLLHRLSTYPKPVAAIMHGATMGGGAALAMSCSIRVATRQTYFALPECKVGFFPAGGMASRLGRCPGHIGMFLALTGVALRARGLVHAGLATHLVPEDRVALVTPALVNQLAITPAASPLGDIEPYVNQVFSFGSAQEIMSLLQVRGGQWAKATLEQLQPQSPTSLALTCRHLGEAAGKPLAEVLATDYRIAQHLLDGHDFMEGIRAFVTDGDQKPAWQPASLGEVTPAMLDALFAPLAAGADWTPPV